MQLIFFVSSFSRAGMFDSIRRSIPRTILKTLPLSSLHTARSIRPKHTPLSNILARERQNAKQYVRSCSAHGRKKATRMLVLVFSGGRRYAVCASAAGFDAQACAETFPAQQQQQQLWKPGVAPQS